MAKTVAQFYTPRAASEVSGLTPERIVRLCEQIGAPVVVYSIPKHPDGMGQGGYLVPAEMLRRFGDMMEGIDREMLVRLSGDEDRGAE